MPQVSYMCMRQHDEAITPIVCHGGVAGCSAECNAGMSTYGATAHHFIKSSSCKLFLTAAHTFLAAGGGVCAGRRQRTGARARPGGSL